MADNSSIDYSGERRKDDFLSEDEQLFLEESQLNKDSSVTFYDIFVNSIITGVITSHNLQKKANLLSDKSLKMGFKESELLHEEIILYAKKMVLVNKTISDKALELYDYCEENNKFWHNCSVDIYKKHFPALQKYYLERNPQSKTIDFLKSEYIYFFSDVFNGLNATHNAIAIDDKLKMMDYISRLNLDTLEFFNVVKQRKLDYITDEIGKAGYAIEAVKKKKNIKVSLIKVETKPIEEELEKTLEISNLPAFNLEERFEIFRRLGFEKDLIKLVTAKKNKNVLLALIMGCSVDNARKFLDDRYKSNLDEEKRKVRKAEIIEKIDDFLYRNNIKF